MPEDLISREKVREVAQHIFSDPVLIMAVNNVLRCTPAADSWIPVTERLPKSEDANSFGEIMVWLRSTETQALWKWRLAVDHPEAISHWMPLPQPPKEVK